MFDQINFLSYEFPADVIPPRSFGRKLRSNFKKQMGEVFSEEDVLPDNTEVSLSGKMETFARSPVPAFAQENLFHMEAFSIFTCGAESYTRRSNYHSFMILYTYEGNGVLEYDGKRYELIEGDGFFIDCCRPQYYCAGDAGWRHGVLHLNGPLLPALFQEYFKNGNVVFSQALDGSYHTSLEKLLSIYSYSDTYRDWEASSCINEMLTDLLKSSLHASEHASSIPDNIRYLMKYMAIHFTLHLSLDYLADFSGFSKYHLLRKFKKYTGYSPNDYLILLRVEHAKSLLLSTTIPANKIAHMSGFRDVNNFTNLFKKKTGITPGEFRKTADRF